MLLAGLAFQASVYEYRLCRFQSFGRSKKRIGLVTRFLAWRSPCAVFVARLPVQAMKEEEVCRYVTLCLLGWTF